MTFWSELAPDVKFVKVDSFVYQMLYDVLFVGKKVGHVYRVHSDKWIDGAWYGRHLDKSTFGPFKARRRAAQSLIEWRPSPKPASQQL